ncbi:isocitrate dehydrogenase [PVC group bacterium (ex Bugula neritina AB1)]|nr:isocitrate dehydrogenase [PVC group bacterium (ex Bugula neritina AB1)]
MHKVTFIDGDGIGPEIAKVTRDCLEATGVKFDWDIKQAGIDIMEKEGTPLPANVIESIKKNKIAIKAPITTPIGKGFRSVNVTLRKELDLYACLRPCRIYPGVKTKFKDVDLVVVRENTEDLYAGIEFDLGSSELEDIKKCVNQLSPQKIKDDAALSLKPISISGTERIVKFAFEYAKAHGRKKVTAVTKANIMKHTDGLFYRVARDIATSYPGITYEETLVDAMCMHLVQHPEWYDVLVMPNLYGDILSDLCAGLVGGLGVAPGGNFGKDMAIFEATHGSAPKYKGMNKVNPTALLLSGVMMLHHLNESDAANRLEKAISHVIQEGKDVTYDLKPRKDDVTAVGTSQMGEAIIRHLKG